MSRGPGRMMRAVLRDLDRTGSASAFGVAMTAHHDAVCDCGSHLCPDYEKHSPTRSEMVSARRALHALANRGVIELTLRRFSYTSPSLVAKRCPSRELTRQATHTEAST